MTPFRVVSGIAPSDRGYPGLFNGHNIQFGQVSRFDEPGGKIRDGHSDLTRVDGVASLCIQFGYYTIKRCNDREGSHTGFRCIHPRFKHSQLIGIRATLHAFIGALGFFKRSLFQCQIILGFDNPILRSWTLEMFSVGPVLIPSRCLNKKRARFSLWNFLCFAVEQIPLRFIVDSCEPSVNYDLGPSVAGSLADRLKPSAR